MTELPCVYLGRELPPTAVGVGLRHCRRGHGPVAAADCAACRDRKAPYRPGQSAPAFDASRLRAGGCCG